MLLARLQFLLLCCISVRKTEGKAQLFVPSAVNVSKGEVAVVCFQADFDNVTEEARKSIQLNLTLTFEEIETTPADYESDSVPSNVFLDELRPVQCLQIPTYNNTERRTPSESFRINVTSVPPVVTPIGSSVLVTLLERCVDGDVRLIDGDNTLEGRVQMCFNGVFGFVCDTDGWMQEEADVVCTQLGSIAIPGIHWHDILSISGPLNANDIILPGRFQCLEQETSLLQCLNEPDLPILCSPNSAVRCFANINPIVPSVGTPAPDKDITNAIEELTSMLTEENLMEQVVQFSEALAATENDTSVQTPAVLDTTADYFEGVADIYRTRPDGDPIPPISKVVVGSLVETLNILQQWDSTVTSSTSDTSSILKDFEFVASLFAQQESVSVNIEEGGITFVAESLPLDDLMENGQSFTFGDDNDDTEPENASVVLPPELFQDIGDPMGDSVGVIFALYMESTLFPIRQPVRMDNDTSTLRTEAASPVVAATVGAGQHFTDLESSVVIYIRLDEQAIHRPNEIMRPGSEVCVSWDFDAAGGQGNWTRVGCKTQKTDDPNIIRCICNHLTNFAVLVDICTRADDACVNDSLAETVLSMISYIGASMSLTGLAITIFTLLYFRKMRARDASKYHVQLSIAIFLMLLVFVSGVDQTSRYEGCVLVSVLIHYFSLAAVMWMGAEAILMFHKLVFVFKRVTKRGIVITSIICWTVPLVPVLIPLIIDLVMGNDTESDLVVRRGDDDSDGFCFLSDTIVFFAAFLGPIFAIIIFNVVVYIVVIVILVKHTRGTMARKKESLNTRTLIRLMVSIAGVMFLFGLSWLFGALTITVQEVRLTFQVLFAVFTSLQGFFIFLFFCVFSREARELWKELLSCGRYQSAFLNPTRKFSTTSTGEKYGTPRNGAFTRYGSKSTRESSVINYKTRPSSSNENIISSRSSTSTPARQYQELSSKANLDFTSIVDEEKFADEEKVEDEEKFADEEKIADEEKLADEEKVEDEEKLADEADEEKAGEEEADEGKVSDEEEMVSDGEKVPDEDEIAVAEETVSTEEQAPAEEEVAAEDEVADEGEHEISEEKFAEEGPDEEPDERAMVSEADGTVSDEQEVFLNEDETASDEDETASAEDETASAEDERVLDEDETASDEDETASAEDERVLDEDKTVPEKVREAEVTITIIERSSPDIFAHLEAWGRTELVLEKSTEEVRVSFD